MTAHTRVRSTLPMALVAILMMFATLASAQAQDEPRYGGILRVAWSSEPPTLDMMQSSSQDVRRVAQPMFEPLFSYDADGNLAPMLAESYELSDDRLVYTIRIRENVPFHNGKIMGAEDVVASILRFGRIASAGDQLMEDVEEVVAVDDRTIEVRLSEANSVTPYLLGSAAETAIIIPKEIAEAAGDEALTHEQYIGTGPYKFESWAPGREVRYSRFEDYAALDAPASGYVGEKSAYVDEIRIYFVTDIATRVNGVIGGDYDMAVRILADQKELLDANPRIETYSLLAGSSSMVFNKRQGIMSNVLMRRAWMAALDLGVVSQAGHGVPEFYRVDPGIMWQETAWWTDETSEEWNAGDPELARRLLDEAGYHGEPIRWMVRPEHTDYASALAARQQLEDAGFNTQLEVLEWGTLSQRRYEEDAWDVFSGTNSFRTHPILHSHLKATWAGWWENEEKEEALERLVAAREFEEQFEAWQDIQSLYYSDVPIVKLNDYFELVIASSDVENFVPLPETIFWNVWLDR